MLGRASELVKKGSSIFFMYAMKHPTEMLLLIRFSTRSLSLKKEKLET